MTPVGPLRARLDSVFQRPAEWRTLGSEGWSMVVLAMPPQQVASGGLCYTHLFAEIGPRKGLDV